MSGSTGKTIQSYVSGQAIYTFGNAALIKNTSWTATSKRRVPIKHCADQAISAADKYMFDTLLEKSLSAADRLFDIAHQVCVKLQHDRDAAAGATKATNAADTNNEDEDDPADLNIFESLVHPDAASQHRITCAGRICCDAAEAVQLTAGSTLLCSTDDRRMRTVRLHLGSLRSFALYAGQTVAVRGRNPRGDILYVDEVHTERQLVREAVPSAVVEPLSVLVCSGPFTRDDDLTYEVLHDFLAYCRDNRPDVVVLLGPFVAASHAMVVDGVLQETFEEFFERIVAEVMEKLG